MEGKKNGNRSWRSFGADHPDCGYLGHCKDDRQSEFRGVKSALDRVDPDFAGRGTHHLAGCGTQSPKTLNDAFESRIH
jgi:hypothetical protein